MDGTRFDGLAKVFARKATRRSTLRGIGYGGAATGLLAVTGGLVHGAAAASELLASTPAADDTVPFLTPFQATVRQGPSAGTDYLGFLALAVDESGAATGGFVTTSEATIPVSGQITGQAINLIFTPADDMYLYGVGVSDQSLAGIHGYADVAMGGPLVGPGAGDAGDWAVPITTVVTGQRSKMCKTCLQSCRNGFGFGLPPTDPSVCRDVCIQFGDAGYGGCADADF